MEVIPAIDIRDGKCVRLTQGQYDQETIFADDPVDVARKWQDLGATRLHIVDLDGAKMANKSTLDCFMKSFKRLKYLFNVEVVYVIL